MILFLCELYVGTCGVLSKLSLYLAKLKDWSIDSFLGSAAWPRGEALLTSPGTGDCIGLSQVLRTYSRGRDLHGFFFFFFWFLVAQ